MARTRPSGFVLQVREAGFDLQVLEAGEDVVRTHRLDGEVDAGMARQERRGQRRDHRQGSRDDAQA